MKKISSQFGIRKRGALGRKQLEEESRFRSTAQMLTTSEFGTRTSKKIKGSTNNDTPGTANNKGPIYSRTSTTNETSGRHWRTGKCANYSIFKHLNVLEDN